MRPSIIASALSMVILVLASVVPILAIYDQTASRLVAILGALIVLPIPVAIVQLSFVLKPDLDL